MTSAYLYLNDLRFHYLRWNPSGERRPIVLHHGLASNARIWELMAPRLAQAGHPVYALEARGHGLTDKPDAGYDFQTITNDLAAFIDACQIERPLLVGHSWGGGVILRYAARFAIGPRAPAGIVLLDGGLAQMDDGTGAWEDTLRRLTPPKLAGMPVDEFTEKLRAWNADWNPPEAAILAYLASFEVREDDTIAPRLTLERHLVILRAMWEYHLYDDFPGLRCPALALPTRRPNDDPRHRAAKEAGARRLLAACPQAQVSWLDDTIHDAPLQRPEQLAQAILDFASTLHDWVPPHLTVG